MDILGRKDPDVLFDKRLVDRHIVKGLVSGKIYDEHLANLPDRVEHIDGSHDVGFIGFDRVTIGSPYQGLGRHVEDNFWLNVRHSTHNAV